MAIFVFILQIILTLALIILMAIQTDKAEQGGVMGLGAAGGRTSGSIDMPVGMERILKPLTKWVGIGFLFTSILSAIPDNKLTFVHFIVALAIYVLVMLYGETVWRTVMGTRR